MCYQYWPDSDIKKYGEYSVEIVKSTNTDGFVERIISVSDKVEQYCSFLLTSYRLTLSSPTVKCKSSSGDSVPDTKLELPGQVFLPTDHHHCGRGGQQGAA